MNTTTLQVLCYSSGFENGHAAAIAEARALSEENTRLRKTIEALRSRQAGLLRGREELAQVLREKAR